MTSKADREELYPQPSRSAALQPEAVEPLGRRAHLNKGGEPF
jgi:hypothetical protein